MDQSYDWDRAPFNDTIFLHVQMPFRRSVYLPSNPFRTSNFSYSNVIVVDYDVFVFFINLLAYPHWLFFVFWLPLFLPSSFCSLVVVSRWCLSNVQHSLSLSFSLSSSLQRKYNITARLIFSAFMFSFYFQPMVREGPIDTEEGKEKKDFFLVPHMKAVWGLLFFICIFNHIYLSTCTASYVPIRSKINTFRIGNLSRIVILCFF